MWFVYVLVGLALLVAGGIYARRRITEALRLFGVRERPIRIFRWAILWLLFGYPLLIIASIIVTLIAGREALFRFDGLVTSILLAMPFIWSVLVVVQAVPWLIAIDVVHLVTKKRHPRRRAIATLVAVGAFAIYTPARILIERGTVRVRTYQVGEGTLPPFRIGFVADIQEDDFTDAARAREVYAMINAAHPDVVLSGGDWINTSADFIAETAAAAGTLKSKLGTFSVRGDHEHFAYLDRERSVREVEAALKEQGVAMLANEVRTFTHEGKRIAVGFVNYNYVVRSTREQIEALLNQLDRADYKIVVTHQLDHVLAGLLENRVDLVLAAHTHGGQVNPVVGLFHVKLARLETTFIDGRYELGRTTVIVTSGVGMSVVPIRYAAPGSIEIVDLRL